MEALYLSLVQKDLFMDYLEMNQEIVERIFPLTVAVAHLSMMLHGTRTVKQHSLQVNSGRRCDMCTLTKQLNR